MLNAVALISFLLSGNGNLFKRDACDGTDAMLILYHDYLNDVCPQKYEVNSKGVCDHINAENWCVAYCQQSTRFVY
ncbi:hypothetical protein N7533_011393 [Penicillium manginii]|uniref:uncharacterized protein n=1 Tax=Penicillium manginii TaxID=203109 RepID=UPI002549BEAA|nr:uncharacterized protein N7533_011393 [Penicillium manginii]KAJ5741984.1 hypothetical protein N7533_011393 [Penicillium manginii]